MCIAHIRKNHHLEHHHGMITGISFFAVCFERWVNIQLLQNIIHDPDRVVFGNQLLKTIRKQQELILIIMLEIHKQLSDYQA